MTSLNLKQICLTTRMTLTLMDVMYNDKDESDVDLHGRDQPNKYDRGDLDDRYTDESDVDLHGRYQPNKYDRGDLDDRYRQNGSNETEGSLT